MPSFLDGLIGTVNTPSTAFNYGAAAAANQYPAAPQGYPAGLGITPQQAALLIQQQRDDADRQYGLQKQQADNQYRVELMNARSTQDVQAANARYQEAQAQIARDRLQFDRDTQQQEFGLKQQQFGLQQAQLGYSVLGQAAALSGPADYFKADEFSRGVSSNPNTSTFLSALQSNARLPGFNAQGGVPQPLTMDSLAAKLGGGGAGTDSGTPGASPDNTGNYLAQIGNIGAKGAQQLGAGSLEQLTPTEMSLFTGGLGKLGYDVPSFLDSYTRSRIGQGAGTSRAA